MLYRHLSYYQLWIPVDSDSSCCDHHDDMMETRRCWSFSINARQSESTASFSEISQPCYHSLLISQMFNPHPADDITPRTIFCSSFYLNIRRGAAAPQAQLWHMKGWQSWRRGRKRRTPQISWGRFLEKNHSKWGPCLLFPQEYGFEW